MVLQSGWFFGYNYQIPKGTFYIFTSKSTKGLMSRDQKSQSSKENVMDMTSKASQTRQRTRRWRKKKETVCTHTWGQRSIFWSDKQKQGWQQQVCRAALLQVRLACITKQAASWCRYIKAASKDIRKQILDLDRQPGGDKLGYRWVQAYL